jgi:NADPH:quinone reductase-like Zn-dependent oxidoreductase
VRAETGPNAPIRLAIDAAGGAACERLGDCLSDGGKIVNYGFLSGKPCRVTPHQLIIRGLSLHGFWLVGFMRQAAHHEIEALYQEMAGLFMDGTLDVPIEASYGLDDIAQALAHAHREARGGKILLTPSGD